MSLTGSQFSRRDFLRGSIFGFGVCVSLPALAQEENILEQIANAVAPSFNLNDADENGVMLPSGFTSRVIAASGNPIIENGYVWHSAPAGGGVFPLSDDGWVYVSNSDVPGTGGAGAIRFNAAGNITNSYSVLSNTQWNSAGTVTPWGTWLSSENHPFGRVFACDALGKETAEALPGLGVFRHGGVIVEPGSLTAYLFENQIDGLFYRFTATDLLANGAPNLTSGVLEAAFAKDDGRVEWRPVPSPLAGEFDPLRKQLPGASAFNRAGGAVAEGGVIYFITAGDAKIWAYDARANTLGVFYDLKNAGSALNIPAGNIAAAPNGGFVVGEAGGQMGIVMITAEGNAFPVLRLEGHSNSEIAGMAFSPDGKRLYFASKRGSAGVDEDGIVFEISGNFAAL